MNFLNFSNSSRRFSNASFHSLLDAADGVDTGGGIAVDEEEEAAAAGTGGVSDLLREGMAAGSLGIVDIVEGGGCRNRHDKMS